MAGIKRLGNRIAPARFIIFFVMLGASIALATLIAPWWRSVMIGFDLSSLVFIASCVRLFFAKPAEMRKIALENDANRAILLFLAFALGVVILVAVGSEMAGSKHSGPIDIAITIVTLLVAWFFGNTVYSLHYAHLYYSSDDGGRDRAGITFPGGDKTPTFSDFVYLAFTIGSALSVSDNTITSPHIRRVVTLHTIVAFIYNVGIFALTVNMLAGKG
ncbi:MAG: DUF1345 domain-containing protein [Pseudomonadota bacterium]|nr:DUF1345 domain-containing protein [Pseudomonadota bacterium]